MKWVQIAGLVKFDFLGLKTLTLIDNCARLVKTNNPSFNIEKVHFFPLGGIKQVSDFVKEAC